MKAIEYDVTETLNGEPRRVDFTLQHPEMGEVIGSFVIPTTEEYDNRCADDDFIIENHNDWDDDLEKVVIDGYHSQQRLVTKAKEFILEDMSKGVIPITLMPFSELHDYVDANYYLTNNFTEGSGDLDLMNRVSKDVEDWMEELFHTRCIDLMGAINMRLGIDSRLSLDEYLIKHKESMTNDEVLSCEHMLGYDNPEYDTRISRWNKAKRISQFITLIP